MHRVLVTDGHYRKTLAAVRSLGRRGLYVELCESDPVCTARFSRYCQRFHLAPDIYDPEPYVEFLRRRLRAGYEMLFPMEEQTCLNIARNRDIVPAGTGLLLSTYEQFCEVRDKKKAFKIARRLGIPTPVTHTVRRAEDLRDLPLPLIIRPRTGMGTVGVRYASTLSEAERAWGDNDDPLVQNIIDAGFGTGVAVLMNAKSEPRAVFTHERIRENPPRGGPSTVARSARRPEMEEQAVRFLKEVGWVGLAQLEFRHDAADGVARFIEVNPRPWGTFQLAIAAGVDFPYLYWRLCREGDIEPVRDYRTGVVFRWILPGDLLHFCRNRNRWRDLPAYFGNLMGRNVTHAIFAADDPMPVFGRLLSVPQFLLR
ncbi:MAG: carboxylate--amine ligase [Planctomycetota bacterium]